MNIRFIKSLAQIMQASGLTSIEVSEGDTRIRLEKTVHMVPAHYAQHPPGQGGPEPETDERVVDFNLITEVTSPMVGVFYASPSPDAEPYVRVGDRVKKGDVLCIIEAMKVMNEIVSETDGEVVDICVQNGQVVEYSQVLFKIF